MRENTSRRTVLGVRVIYLTCDYRLLARSLLRAFSIGQQAKTFRLVGCVTPNISRILRSTQQTYHEKFLPTFFQFSVDDAIYTSLHRQLHSLLTPNAYLLCEISTALSTQRLHIRVNSWFSLIKVKFLYALTHAGKNGTNEITMSIVIFIFINITIIIILF